MAPLDDRDFMLDIHVGESVVPVVNDKAVNSKLLRGPKLVSVCLGGGRIFGARPFLLESDLVVRVKHNELQGKLVGDKGVPFAVCFLLNIDVELNMIFDFIVLGVGAAFNSDAPLITLFVVSQVGGSQDTTLTKIPVDQLSTEIVVN